MGGDNAETYEGLEAAFRLHVSSTHAAIKVHRYSGSSSCTADPATSSNKSIWCYACGSSFVSCAAVLSLGNRP
jgi:hypothetical protein